MSTADEDKPLWLQQRERNKLTQHAKNLRA
jgi:hypothetical protein